MFGCPCLERKCCATTSTTVRRVVGGGEAELANNSFKSRSEEGRGDRSKAGCSRKAEERIVRMGRHQAEVAVDEGDWAERRMWDAGQRDDMNSFYLGVSWTMLCRGNSQNLGT